MASLPWLHQRRDRRPYYNHARLISMASLPWLHQRETEPPSVQLGVADIHGITAVVASKARANKLHGTVTSVDIHGITAVVASKAVRSGVI